MTHGTTGVSSEEEQESRRKRLPRERATIFPGRAGSQPASSSSTPAAGDFSLSQLGTRIGVNGHYYAKAVRPSQDKLRSRALDSLREQTASGNLWPGSDLRAKIQTCAPNWTRGIH